MLQDQCISITDLRKHTTKCFHELKKGEKYVFINNKPVAVIIDINVYEDFFSKPKLLELPEEEMTPEIKKLAMEDYEMKKNKDILKKRYKKSSKSGKSSLVI